MKNARIEPNEERKKKNGQKLQLWLKVGPSM